MTNISDFVKMINCDQNCKFPWNARSPFGEKWELHTRKTHGVNTCTRKFTEENIVFTQWSQSPVLTFYQKLPKCGFCKMPKFRPKFKISTKFRPKFKISTKFRQNLVKIWSSTPENAREIPRAHRNLRSKTSFLPNLHDCVTQKFYKNLQKFQILQNLEILVDTVFLAGFSRLKNNV